MKKLLLVSVVGLSALLGGCGGGEDCEESPILPPVEDVAKFPRGQAPEYIIRDTTQTKAGTKDSLLGQALSISPTSDGDQPASASLVLQEFTADYTNGYLTKPTMNVHEFTYVYFTANNKVRLTGSDLTLLKDELLTLSKVGYLEPILPGTPGTYTFNVSVQVEGQLEDLVGDIITIQGIEYKVGKVADGVVLGDYVSGIRDGENLNVYKLSFSTPAWGYSHEVEVFGKIDEDTFTYINNQGNEMRVTMRPCTGYEKDDRLCDTTKFELFQKVKLSGNYYTFDSNTMEASDVAVYLIK